MSMNWKGTVIIEQIETGFIVEVSSDGVKYAEPDLEGVFKRMKEFYKKE